jgi:hypothetical protein
VNNSHDGLEGKFNGPRDGAGEDAGDCGGDRSAGRSDVTSSVLTMEALRIVFALLLAKNNDLDDGFLKQE